MNETYLLKYILRRTNISLFISSLESGLAAGKIDPRLSDNIRSLLDDTLGLPKCICDVEDLPDCDYRVMHRLLLSYGGPEIWNEFSQMAQRSNEVAIRTLEGRKVDRLCPYVIVQTISELEAYLSMLLWALDYNEYGCPPFGNEEEFFRDERRRLIRRRKIPTTNQERLSFLLQRTLRELKRTQDHFANVAHPTEPKICEHSQSNPEILEDTPAPDPAYESEEQDGTGISGISGIVERPDTSDTPRATRGARTPIYARSSLESLIEIMTQGYEASSISNMSGVREEMEEIFQRAEKLQERLAMQPPNETVDSKVTAVSLQEISQQETPDTQRTQTRKQLPSVPKSSTRKTVESEGDPEQSKTEEKLRDKGMTKLSNDTGMTKMSNDTGISVPLSRNFGQQEYNPHRLLCCLHSA
jgi:hypothetical protein